MSNENSKTAKLSEVQSLVTGLPKYCATMSFTYNGATSTCPQLVAVFQGLLDAAEATVQAKAAYKAALAKESALLTTVMPQVSATRQTLALSFASDPNTLAGCGVSARKKAAPLTTEQEAAKVAKAKATRAARGTKGAVQKASIVGNVTGVTITPVVAASGALSPSVTPASSTAVATGGASSKT